MTIFTEPIHTLRGEDASLADFGGKAILAVNVASKCGLTPQYTGLEALQQQYADRGFTVVGFPCNQFGAQEPGSAEEIEAFCSTTYGVTFPMMEKIDVNGDRRHPIYTELTRVADSEGHSGDIRWNFEKFLIAADGTRHPICPCGQPRRPCIGRGDRGRPARLTPAGLNAARDAVTGQEHLKSWPECSDRLTQENVRFPRERQCHGG